MNDEMTRIRGYLQAQGAKQSVPAAVDRVRAGMADLKTAAAAVPSARWTERPAPEEWSANDVMAHVVSAGTHFGDQIVQAIDGITPTLAPREPAGASAPHRTPAEWFEMLARDREALFARVLRADPDAQLDHPIAHGMFGELNWRETLLFIRLHDLDHADQLQKIAVALASPPPGAINS